MPADERAEGGVEKRIHQETENEQDHERGQHNRVEPTEGVARIRTEHGLVDRALRKETADHGGQDDPVLRQACGPVPDHLAGKHLERSRGVEHQLHDATALLLGHAHSHPHAIGDDGHEDEHDQPSRQQVRRDLAADAVGGAGRRIDRQNRERRRLHRTDGSPSSGQRVVEREQRHRGPDARHNRPVRGQIRSKREGQVLARRVAVNDQESVELAVLQGLLGRCDVALREPANDEGRVGSRRDLPVERFAQKAERVGWHTWGADDLQARLAATRGEIDQNRQLRRREGDHGQQDRAQDEAAGPHSAAILPDGYVPGIREERSPALHALTAFGARVRSVVSIWPTCSMKISSSVGSAISKWRISQPRLRAARRTAPGSWPGATSASV